MTDREKVISYFEYAVNKAHGEGWDFVNLSTEDAKEILALLKEHEPTEPICNLGITRCGNCNHEIDKYEGVNYCPNCGKKVDWEWV